MNWWRFVTGGPKAYFEERRQQIAHDVEHGRIPIFPAEFQIAEVQDSGGNAQRAEFTVRFDQNIEEDWDVGPTVVALLTRQVGTTDIIQLPCDQPDTLIFSCPRVHRKLFLETLNSWISNDQSREL